MRRRFLGAIGLMFFLAGCTALPAAQSAQPGGNDAAALAPSPTYTPNVIYVTATPNPAETQVSAAGSEVAETPVSDSSLTITGIDDLGGGRAVVHWDANGSFPFGFVVTWTEQTQRPVFPGDNYNYAVDPNSRSALVTLQRDKVYLLRVCRFTGSRCDVYSNLSIFTLKIVKPVPYFTAVASSSGGTTTISTSQASSSYNASGTPVSFGSDIVLTGVSAAGTGKAKVAWAANGSFSQGFAIVYSTSTTAPYVGGYPYYVVGDSAARSAYVDGTPGTVVYYRVCRYTGSSCDVYSNTYTYLFPGSLVATATPDPATIVINSVAPTATLGQASITWTATGSFPSGFKILISKTNAAPTISAYDQLFVVSSGSATSTTFTGDPGASYYVRMCKIVAGTCGNYSNVATVTFTADTSTISNLQVSDGSLSYANVTWEASEDAPQGFKILFSTVHATPTLQDSWVYVSDGSLRAGTFSGDPGSTYYVRVCRYINTSCSVYSDVVSITLDAGTTPTVTIEGISDTGEGTAMLRWSSTGEFPDGYRILVSETNDPPLVSDQQSLASSADAPMKEITGTPGTAYYVSICRVEGSGCGVTSTVWHYTFGKITLGSFTLDGSGNATLAWTYTGSNTPAGFSALFSTTNTSPSIADHEVQVDAGSSSTSVNATLTAGVAYYYRVCSGDGTACIINSAVGSYTP